MLVILWNRFIIQDKISLQSDLALRPTDKLSLCAMLKVSGAWSISVSRLSYRKQTQVIENCFLFTNVECLWILSTYYWIELKLTNKIIK